MRKTSLVAAVPALALVIILSAQAFAVGAVAPVPAQPSGDSGFVQFNNLTVESVSGTSVPAEIQASVGTVKPVSLEGSSGSAAGSALAPSNCYRFQSSANAQGTVTTCPPGIARPIQTYNIDVTSNTQLMLRDRSQASLSDFAQGDQINVYGYYNTDGSITAYLVRDLSKPIEAQTIQLNNATLVSISISGTSATLAVTQAQGAPCLGFEGDTSKAIACPLGVSSFSAVSSTASVTAPATLAPNWIMLRKYVVNIDSRTTVLDRNRTVLSLANLTVGDSLNIFGETTDNGQTITADIVRDLSLPVQASTFNGTVTQLNADGSFVMQTSDGRSITVPSPLSIGETVSVQGILSASGTLSQISRFTAGTGTANGPLLPVQSGSVNPSTNSAHPPGGPSGTMIIQGGAYPPNANGGPINY